MSLRKTLATATTALLLSTGLIVSAPTTMGSPGYDIDKPKTWGATRAPDQVLKNGCHKYRYRYRIDVPDWAAEIFLINRHGRTVAHDVVFHTSDPRKASRRWSSVICKASTVYGKHRIKMKITWNPDSDDPTPDNIDGFVKTTAFRLTRP